jgi:hypothetical protein
LSSFLSQLFGTRKKAEPSPRDLVLAQRERLLGCALQILQDGHAAQEVVLKGLGQALQSPLLVPLSGDGAPPAGGVEALVRWLDRLDINLALARLRQGSPLRPGAHGTSAAGHAGEQRPLLEALRRGAIPTAPPPLRPTPTPVTQQAVPTPLPERRTPSGGLPVQLGADVVPPGARPQPALLAGLPAPQDGAGQKAPRPPAGEPAPRRVPMEVMQLERMGTALRGLSPETRVTVTLVLVQGRSLAEAAELLGCQLESCRYWLLHGRKQLRRVLQRDLIEAEPEPSSTSMESPGGVLYDVRRGKKAAARA